VYQQQRHDVSGIVAARAAAPGPVVLFGTYELMGTGLNLQEADTVILMDLPWQSTQYDQVRTHDPLLHLVQARFRALRDGQTPGRVSIYTLLAVGTEEVAQRQNRSGVKRGFASRFVDEAVLAPEAPADITFDAVQRVALWDRYRARPAIRAAIEAVEAGEREVDVDFSGVVAGS